MNVKTLRDKLGISQQELADRTGIPKDRIAKWEQGKGNPKSEDNSKLMALIVEDVPHGIAKKSPEKFQALVDKVEAHDDLMAIVLNELASLKASASGTHPEVELKRLEKAAEDVAKLRRG